MLEPQFLRRPIQSSGEPFLDCNGLLWVQVFGVGFWNPNICLGYTKMLQVTRSVTIRAWGGEDQVSLSDKTKASAMAGTVAGAMGGLIRKLHRNVKSRQY